MTNALAGATDEPQVVVDLVGRPADRRCQRCASVKVVVHVLDDDPLVANEHPDELRCVVCGQVQTESPGQTVVVPQQ